MSVCVFSVLKELGRLTARRGRLLAAGVLLTAIPGVAQNSLPAPGTVTAGAGVTANRGSAAASVARGSTSETPPVLSPAEIAARLALSKTVNRATPIPDGPLQTILPPTTPPALPPVFSATNSAVPQASTDFVFQKTHRFTAAEAGTGTSTVGESSLGGLPGGQTILYTSNWFAAISTNGGNSFSYVNPYTTFPSINRGFCCDQVVQSVPSRNMVVWALQYVKDNTSGTLRIAVGVGGAVAANTWTYYNFNPQDLGFASGNWFDFPNLSVSSNYLYVTSNVFKTNGDAFSGAMVLRIPLGQLAVGGTVDYEYLTFTSVGSVRCAEGATTTAYCGVHLASNKVRIFRWDDGDPTIFWDDVQLSGFTYLSSGKATSPDGSNFAGDSDSRILGSWVSNGVIGLMFNAQQDSRFPFPYTIVARFSQSSRALLTQEPIWNPSFAFLYPAIGVNNAGNLAGVIAYGGGPLYPNEAAFIVDDLHPTFVPLESYQFTTGNRGPGDDRWGDFFSSRRSTSSPGTWIGGGYELRNGDTSSSVVQTFASFGRARDFPATSPLTIGTPDSLVTGIVGQPYSPTTISASGGTPPYAWSATGLPANLSIAAGTGVISGVANSAGTSSVTVKVTDAAAGSATKNYSLTINTAPAPTITGPAALQNGTVGQSYPAISIIAAGGTPPYTWSVTGLPANLSIGVNSGVISGTPTIAGAFNVIVKVTDAGFATATKAYSLTINTTPNGPAITGPNSLTNGTANQPYPPTTVTATGGNVPYTWSATGFPPNIAINPSTGAISGTPASNGVFSVIVKVTDAALATDSKTYTLTIGSTGGVVLGIGSGSAGPGQSIEVPISLTTLSGLQPAGFQADASFDSQKLSYVSSRIGPELTNANKSLSTSVQSNNDVRFLGIGLNQSTIANGTMAFVTFKLSSNFPAGTSTTVTLKNCQCTDVNSLLLTTSCGTGSITAGCTCDANGDSNLNVADVQFVINQVLNGTVSTCHSGGVNVADVQRVINAVLGLGCN